VKEIEMWYNPLVTWLLHSPLRRLMEGSTLLLTYTGCKSGKSYTFPISYAQSGRGLRLITRRQKTWWKNLGTDAAVSVWLRGEPHTGQAAVAALEPAERMAAMQAVYRGMPRRLAEQQAADAIVVDILLNPSAAD
jgi:hypothetical protein